MSLFFLRFKHNAPLSHEYLCNSLWGCKKTNNHGISMVIVYKNYSDVILRARAVAFRVFLPSFLLNHAQAF